MSTNDIFADLSALQLSDTDAAGLTGARELLSHGPVRKPNRHESFRVHPDPAMSLSTTVFTDKKEQETFFVTPNLHAPHPGTNIGAYKMNVEMIDTGSKPRLEDTARPKGYAGFFKGNPDRNLPPGRILSDLSRKRRQPE